MQQSPWERRPNDSTQVRAQLSLLQQALADEKSLCLLPSQPGSGLGNQAGEQSWFRDVLEGALAVLTSHLCPAATCSQVLCSKGWFRLETNPRPLLLPNHFLQRALSHIKSSSKVLAIALHGKLSKCGSEQGPAFLSFSVGKAGGQAVRSCNKPRDLCFVH